MSFMKGLNLKGKVQGIKPLLGKEEHLEKIDERIVVFSNPDSLASEQYRVLYSRLLQLYGNDKKKIFAISSSIKGEGKTTTCLNLGAVIAKDFSKRVLIIEGDLKKPDLHTYLGSPIEKGLIELLLGKENFGDCIYSFHLDNLFLLPTVKREVNSAKLLSLPAMGEMLSQALKEFEYIIIDCPPVLPLADMNIYSELLDGILFVIRAGKTPRDLVKKSMDCLPPGKILAIIMNGVETDSGKFYGYPY